MNRIKDYKSYRQYKNKSNSATDFKEMLGTICDTLNNEHKEDGKTFSYGVSLSGTKGEVYEHPAGCECGWHLNKD